MQWVQNHRARLKNVHIYATGHTGGLIQESCHDLQITCLKSGPRGGDQQVGALIAENKLDALFFFIDALSPHPHDVDVKALFRLATLYNIPFASNEATANLIVKNYHKK